MQNVSNSQNPLDAVKLETSNFEMLTNYDKKNVSHAHQPSEPNNQDLQQQFTVQDAQVAQEGIFNMAMTDNTNSKSDIKRAAASSRNSNMPFKPPIDDSHRKVDVKHETKLREKVQDLKERLHPPRPRRSETNNTMLTNT